MKKRPKYMKNVNKFEIISFLLVITSDFWKILTFALRVNIFKVTHEGIWPVILSLNTF